MPNYVSLMMMNALCQIFVFECLILSFQLKLYNFDKRKDGLKLKITESMQLNIHPLVQAVQPVPYKLIAHESISGTT